MARLIAFSLGLLGLLIGAPAVRAQTVVTSAAAERVAVTIYRAPGRGAGEDMDLGWLEGYALITEQRTVTIPAGQAVIRFEGVAAGMLPESALVRGLPVAVREKNLDADLLSPRNLYARAFGRPVMLRRQHPKTGKTTEERAIIRSGPDGAAILQTREGFEPIWCGPLAEALVYDGVPEGLSARPTLSIATDAPAEARATLSLSYLAWGFDWDADYVVRMQEDGRSASLYAWVTLANGDPISFPDAEAAVVAGGAHRDDERDGIDGRAEPLIVRCASSPLASSSMAGALPPQPVPAPMEEIVVTAMRRSESIMDAPVKVTEEGLGDLKLYRMPIPTTVAARSQKQVTLHDLADVRLSTVYTSTVSIDKAGPVLQMLRTRNRKEEGLGVNLPTGKVSVFERHGDADLLVGQGSLVGKAVGEDVEIIIGEATQVRVETEETGRKGKRRDIALTVTNANPWPIAFEAGFAPDDDGRERFFARMGRKYGRPLWRVEVPANGSARLRYRIAEIGEE